MEGTEEDSGPGGAEQAFEELRAEVKVLRRAVPARISRSGTLGGRDAVSRHRKNGRRPSRPYRLHVSGRRGEAFHPPH